MSRHDFYLARHICHADEPCSFCETAAEDRARPDAPSAADQDAWSGRWEDAREYWRDSAVAS